MSHAATLALGSKPEHPSGLTMCIECEDQEAAVMCNTCAEPFCGPCFGQQHHRGKRADHRPIPILGELLAQPAGSVVGLGLDPALPTSAVAAPPPHPRPTLPPQEDSESDDEARDVFGSEDEPKKSGVLMSMLGRAASIISDRLGVCMIT